MGLLLLLTACGGNEEDASSSDEGESTEDKGSIEIGLNPWAENIAVSNMWEQILEEKGYDITLNNVDKGALYEAMASQSVDVALEVWLPNTDKPFYDRYKDEINWHEEWYQGTTLGLAVPSYMDIESIEELNEYEDKMDGEIVGIDPGASLMSLTDDVVKEYDLNYDVLSSSDVSMTTELKTAYKNEEPIVVTLWKPHHVFADLDMKFLEDPKNVYGDEENISFMSRKGFPEDHPEVLEWLQNWEMTNDQLGELMATIVENDNDAAKGAEIWLEDNQELVDEWVTSEE